jgi:hypothetical protein
MAPLPDALTAWVVFPHWTLVLPAAMLPSVWMARRWRRRGPHACPACGYDLRGSPGGKTCPECGAEREGLWT